jgi:hypothetical protein
MKYNSYNSSVEAVGLRKKEKFTIKQKTLSVYINIDVGISEGDWHGIILSLTFWIITPFLTINVPYYRNTSLIVQIDVNTAITTTVVIYVVYYKLLPLIILNTEGKVTSEQVMMPYTDSR